MYNKFQTNRGKRISNRILLTLAALLFLLYACGGCVSARKYNLLKQDLDAVNASIQSHTWANDQLRNDIRQLSRKVAKMKK